MNKHPEIKRLGAYLIDAGLITPGQVDVALNDQEFMEDRMRFGDVLVARGWVKQQTLDYLIEKVVEPEQLIARRVVLEDAMTVRHDVHHVPSPRLHAVQTLDPPAVNAPTAEPITLGQIVIDTIEEPITVEEPIVAEPITVEQPIDQNVVAQARSLDGDTVFQIVMPPRHTAASLTPKVDPTLKNERKSLASVDDTEDGLNWVG
jgi:hypothetical protein